MFSLFEEDISRHTRPDPKHDSAYGLILYYIHKASQSPVSSYPKIFMVIYCDMEISGERIITSESWRWLGWVWSARSEAGLGRRVEGNCPRCGCPLAANPPRSPYQKSSFHNNRTKQIYRKPKGKVVRICILGV